MIIEERLKNHGTGIMTIKVFGQKRLSLEKPTTEIGLEFNVPILFEPNHLGSFLSLTRKIHNVR